MVRESTRAAPPRARPGRAGGTGSGRGDHSDSSGRNDRGVGPRRLRTGPADALGAVGGGAERAVPAPVERSDAAEERLARGRGVRILPRQVTPVGGLDADRGGHEVGAEGRAERVVADRIDAVGADLRGPGMDGGVRVVTIPRAMGRQRMKGRPRPTGGLASDDPRGHDVMRLATRAFSLTPPRNARRDPSLQSRPLQDRYSKVRTRSPAGESWSGSFGRHVDWRPFLTGPARRDGRSNVTAPS